MKSVCGLLTLGATWMAAGAIVSGEVYKSAGEMAGKELAFPVERVQRVAVAPATAVAVDGEWVLDNGSAGNAQNGLHWSVPLGQKEALPFAISAETRFEAGQEDSPVAPGYSLYLDVRYADGSSLYGQKFCYLPKSRLGWQKGLVTVVPDKPVKSVDCYVLLRNRDGRIRVRAPHLFTYGDTTFTCFDTTSVAVVNAAEEPAFLLHDAAAPNDGWTAIADGGEAKGVKCRIRETCDKEATFYEVRLEGLTDADRALTFAYSLPLPAGALTWLDDPRTEVAMDRGGCRNTMQPGCGVGGLSRWPFGAVRAGGSTWAIGYDPDKPAIFRVFANGALRRLAIAFDIGLAAEKRTAAFKFVVFKSAGRDGFRGAFEQYARLFPESYKVRIKKHGIWMAFRPIEKVEGWEDFGFAIKEGDGATAWDDAHGILTTHYTEPTSWWMTMKTTNAVTFTEALAEAERRVGDPRRHPYAPAWAAGTYKDIEGRITGNLCDRPWCKGACWNLNPLPGILGGEYTVKLCGRDFTRRYRDKAFPEGVDGEYIDSAECHLPPRIDFNRANFAASVTPLSWDTATKKPGVSTALAIYEYVRGVADRVHAMGRIMQANGAPYSWPWLIPFVDYGGQETKWIEKGEGAWRPMSDRDLLYRMAMSCGKPYCFLMNVKFENLTDEMVEKYFHRCLAYGLMSSFFSPNASGSHYFTRPELYNRHRPLFKKYGPLQRAVSEAGWRPVNRLATSETPEAFAEQFGARYVTVFNPTEKPLAVRLRAVQSATAARELVTGASCAFANGETTLQIPAESVRLLDFE